MSMKTIKTTKEVTLKDGTLIPKGSYIDYVGPSLMETVGIFQVGSRELKLRYRSVLKSPSVNTLQKWEENGYCNTVFGERTEPDGFGPDHEPSWMLALGMI